jgi:serine/threonine protein kinase
MTLKFDLILPELLTDKKVYKINNEKFYNGNFCEVINVISKNEDVSCSGNIVEIENNLIIKWNRKKKDMKLFINEIRYQRVMYSLGFGVKIKQAYSIEKHIFIIMDNLYSLGYETIGELLYEENDEEENPKNEKIKKIMHKKIIKNVAIRINDLHLDNIVHGDIHEYNIFYNKTTDDVKFIDFSDTKFVNGYLGAIESERYIYYYYKKFKTDLLKEISKLENLYLM